MALMLTLQDDFNDNTFNGTLWTRSSATEVLEQNQRLEIKLSAVTPKWLRSSSSYDLTDSIFHFELVSLTVPSLSAGVGLQIGTATPSILGTADKLYFLFDSGGTNFRCSYMVSSSGSNGASTAIGSYKYFRIIESGGTTYWDASTDDITWTNIRSVSTPITITSLYAFAVSGWVFFSANNSLFLDSINTFVSQAITTAHISSGATLYAPTINTTYPITMPFISSSNSLYDPLIVAVGSLSLAFISSSTTPYSPAISVGAVNLTAPLHTNTSTLYTPALSMTIHLTQIASSVSLYQPTISVGAVTISLPIISSASVLYGFGFNSSPIELLSITNINTLYGFILSTILGFDVKPEMAVNTERVVAYKDVDVPSATIGRQPISMAGVDDRPRGVTTTPTQRQASQAVRPKHYVDRYAPIGGQSGNDKPRIKL